VRLLRQPHSGAAAARNRGAAEALGELLLFTDADCRPQPDWAARMAEPFADRTVAGVKGFFRSDQRALVARIVQAEYEEKEAHMLARRRVAFADTASAAYRAEVFRKTGGFRTDMRAVEDTELSFRLAALGHKIVVAPEAIVRHAHPETIAAYARRKWRYGEWGARAYAAFPERVADDSRTPASMRAQLALGPALAAAALAAPLSARARFALPGLAAAFVLSVAPFAWRNRRDPAVALAAPVLFLVRALAVAGGLAVGVGRMLGARGPNEDPVGARHASPLHAGHEAGRPVPRPSTDPPLPARERGSERSEAG